VTLNLSKSGGSLSFGVRGAHFTVGPHGKRVTAGIPGTGLFYTSTLPASKHIGASPGDAQPEDKLTMGFFKRLVTPDDEEAFVDGCRELTLGDETKAFECLQQAIHLVDGAWLAGFLSLKRGEPDEAERYLKMAKEKQSRLGYYFSKYGISASLSLPVTDEISAFVGADLRGVLLGLVEVYQQVSRWPEAIRCLEQLQQMEPDDVVVKLSLAELLLSSDPDNSHCQQVVHLAQDIDNETPIHAALLLYKGRALRRLGLAGAAKTTLSGALRRRKGRTDELLHAIRYERAMAYEDLGQHSRARQDFECIYSDASDYADVANRLGLK